MRGSRWTRRSTSARSSTKRRPKLFERRVEDAVEKGAELLHGAPRNGALFPPTVVDRVPYDCELVHQETFGPVIPIIRVPDAIDEVIRISNSTAYGLSSGVCTNRMDYIARFIQELEVGTVNVWEVPGYRIEMSPFGGIKDSRPRLQGGGSGSDEELHQCPYLVDAFRVTKVAASEVCFSTSNHDRKMETTFRKDPANDGGSA